MNFIKKNYEIFIVNFIFLGFIVITLLAQFGVHIKVEKRVELIPVKMEYRNSTRYIKLEYEDDPQESFWAPAFAVFGRASEYEIKGMIYDGDSIKRNVFINTNSHKVIGVTQSGRSILSLYYYNSQMFRYGILILIIGDIFIVMVKAIHNKKSKQTIDTSKYRYAPEDKRALELHEIIFQLREFWGLNFIIILICSMMGIIYSFALVALYSTEVITEIGLGIGIVILCIIFVMIPLGIITLIRKKAKKKDEKDKIIKNANTYLSNVGEDFLEQLQADLNKGLPFMKKHNLVISDRYIIGSLAGASLNPMVFDPIAIPKEQIREIAYVYYTWGTLRYRFIVQDVYFRLKNGKEIVLPVKDRHNIGLTLKALEDCRVPIIDITQEKKK
ncbi:MAG: hypothetical protein K2K96_11265 [Lachnospiraceae bacterium]|nr:hypothetical protein [Lachnospiraceae bacterium]